MKTKAQELGITNFPYEEFDENGNETYTEFSSGNWFKYKYDENNNLSYFEQSNGYWYKRKCSKNGNLNYKEHRKGDKEYVIL